MRPTERGRESGFSLLEMVVAIAVLALALTALYQASAGATRNLRVDERYAYAVELARSLLADNAVVAADGVRSEGETAGGFRWQVRADPLQQARDSKLPSGTLQTIAVDVAWSDGGRERHVQLHSLVEGSSDIRTSR